MPHTNHTYRRNLILNLVAHLGPISRSSLISISDLRPASVSDLIRELQEEGLIRLSTTAGARGRGRSMLELNHKNLCAIGISFSGSSATFVVVQIDGHILQRDTLPLPSGLSREEFVTQVTMRVQQLIGGYHCKRLIGIGIAEPLYDPTLYRIDQPLLSSYLHFNDWIHLDLTPKLESITGLSVRSFSPVALPAMAELRFGSAQGAQNFLCIELSNGIGASICCNGTVVTGAKGIAGELGHTVIDHTAAHSKLCYCGKPGCVERSTGFPALVSKLKTAMDEGVFTLLRSRCENDKITVSDIRFALDSGDRLCLHYTKELAQRLGVAISNAVNLLNPELIVLYGFMVDLGDQFLLPLEQAIRDNTISLANDFEIRISSAMESILPMGAAAELFSLYLKTEDYNWIYQLRPEDL